MEQRFNADDSDHSGSTTACACGRRARYAGRRPKTFTTLLGPVTLQRAYYHCDACRRGVCPRDQALGLQGSSLSPAITRLVGLTAAEGSFAKASEWLTALAAIRVTDRRLTPSTSSNGDDTHTRSEPTPQPPQRTLRRRPPHQHRRRHRSNHKIANEGEGRKAAPLPLKGHPSTDRRPCDPPGGFQTETLPSFPRSSATTTASTPSEQTQIRASGSFRRSRTSPSRRPWSAACAGSSPRRTARGGI